MANEHRRVRELVAELRTDLAEPDMSPPWPTREELTLLLDYIARLEVLAANARATIAAHREEIRAMARDADAAQARIVDLGEP